MTLFLLILLALVMIPIVYAVAELAWEDFLRPRLRGSPTREQREIRSRFEDQKNLPDVDYLQAHTLAEFVQELAANGIVDDSKYYPTHFTQDDRVWWLRQLFITRPDKYVSTAHRLDIAVREFSRLADDYRTLYKASTGPDGYWFRGSEMDHFESRYPAQAQIIRDEVEAEYASRVKKELEFRKAKGRALAATPDPEDRAEILTWNSSKPLRVETIKTPDRKSFRLPDKK